MRIGIVGAGAIARRAHLPAWKSVSGVEVTALAEVDESLAEKVADEFEVQRWTTDFRHILDDDRIEVVDVCTPTPTHCDIASAALAAGKHVIVEKPLTLSLEHALRLYAQVQETGLQFCIVQNYRYMPPVLRAKVRLEAGNLGKLATVHGRALTRFPSNWTRGKWLYHSGGVLYDFAPHVIDLMLWVEESKVTRVFAFGQSLTDTAEFLGSAQMLVQFASGTVGILDASWVTSAFVFGLDIHGTGGSILLEPTKDVYQEVFSQLTPLDEVRGFVRKQREFLKGVVSGSYSTKSLMAYKALFDDFVESVRTGAEPPVTVEQGVRISIVLEAAMNSITSGEPIEVENILHRSGVSRQIVNRFS